MIQFTATIFIRL